MKPDDGGVLVQASVLLSVLFETSQTTRSELAEGDTIEHAQFFDLAGVRVAIEYSTVVLSDCDSGCGTTFHAYRMPPPGSYDLVHFQRHGSTVHDGFVAEYAGEPAIVNRVSFNPLPAHRPLGRLR